MLDVGCGAGRNALPLAALGAHVVGIDRSREMLDVARRCVAAGPSSGRLAWLRATMDALPVGSDQFDVVVAHGVWNLARSSGEFRRAIAEASRVACSGAALFVVTFSRHTLPPRAVPLAGEPFVFTQFSGHPQCFLTEDELVSELGASGFVLPPGEVIRELNRPRHQALATGGPVLFEGVFVKAGREPLPTYLAP